MNKVILTGRLTKNPESRMAGNVEASTFRLACDNGFTDKNGERDTEFIECVAFNKTAEIINKFCQKGSLISVQGRIKNSSYEKDGVKKYSSRIVAEHLEFLSSAKSNESTSETPKIEETGGEDPYAAFGNEVEIDPNDLPF